MHWSIYLMGLFVWPPICLFIHKVREGGREQGKQGSQNTRSSNARQHSLPGLGKCKSGPGCGQAAGRTEGRVCGENEGRTSGARIEVRLALPMASSTCLWNLTHHKSLILDDNWPPDGSPATQRHHLSWSPAMSVLCMWQRHYVTGTVETQNVHLFRNKKYIFIVRWSFKGPIHFK